MALTLMITTEKKDYLVTFTCQASVSMIQDQTSELPGKPNNNAAPRLTLRSSDSEDQEKGLQST